MKCESTERFLSISCLIRSSISLIMIHVVLVCVKFNIYKRDTNSHSTKITPNPPTMTTPSTEPTSP